MRIGFIGLGIMGTPMALNLVRSGRDVIVWNRSAEKAAVLEAEGAEVAASVAALFAGADVIILMLATDVAIDAVLQRGTPAFASLVAGRTLVHMGTTAPDYSKTLEADVLSAGGAYVEAPVSGSRVPAEAGELVAMLAGAPETVETVQPLLQPLCRDAIVCGVVPNALLMKLAVNIFLISTVTGLAEAANFAASHGLDLHLFKRIADGGQMASGILRLKNAKLAEGDFSPQAAISDVLKNNQLVVDAARRLGIASPLLDVCRALYAETEEMGFGGLDMAAVIKAIAARAAKC
ncbi:NAD(P)-dependent oxidoreductase [Rhizobium sp. BE258]|jgi:3-hydroxyisobutyrate dehydrogenase|uniref:NAD(P)-dependent oxidoreductase n=1 Tax=Rhizobium sp. BE258 TaxID=2817722 RepID=UPI000DD85720|nr:NAD(P)-dependent oxidoreductase [Rhizobium sp. BE258]MDR7142009.1 3-hydroxyisobutyrate dehydrogenase [Rhizobium sp. BE258]